MKSASCIPPGFSGIGSGNQRPFLCVSAGCADTPHRGMSRTWPSRRLVLCAPARLLRGSPAFTDITPAARLAGDQRAYILGSHPGTPLPDSRGHSRQSQGRSGDCGGLAAKHPLVGKQLAQAVLGMSGGASEDVAHIGKWIAVRPLAGGDGRVTSYTSAFLGSSLGGRSAALRRPVPSEAGKRFPARQSVK